MNVYTTKIKLYLFSLVPHFSGGEEPRYEASKLFVTTKMCDSANSKNAVVVIILSGGAGDNYSNISCLSALYSLSCKYSNQVIC